jgi:hypothetical protein
MIDAAEIFRERCEARAFLYAAYDYDLHEAVDALQTAAEANGLIAEIGQDAVQAMMADAFGRTQPTRVPDDVGEEAVTDQRVRVATSTLQAAEYLIMQNDPKRLRAWLATHTRAECNAIRKHLGTKR